MPDSTVYIADIDPLVDQSQVETAVGSGVTSIKLVRDHLGRGHGHALVELGDEDTAQALLAKQHLFIGSSMCRVLSNGSSVPRAAGDGIFIKNLVPEVTVEELHAELSKHGQVSSLRIALTPYGQPRGFAYASYTSKPAVDEAISSMNGREHWGRKLYVGHNLPRRERVHKYDESKSEFTNLFIKGIGQNTTEQDFFDFFTQIGAIDSYSMPIDEYGQPRGFGFVNYKTHADALSAVQKLNNSKLGSRVIQVSRAQQREKPTRVDTPNIYVKNLDLEVSDEELAREFAKFGSIASAKVMLDDTARSRGFGFVCFHDPLAAETAIKKMNGAQVWGNQLYVALAQRKGGRQWRQPVLMNTMYGYVPMMMPMVGGPAPGQAMYYPYYEQPRRRQQDYGSSLSAAIASAENINAEKEVIGEALYPKVQKHQDIETDDLASQITGILLEEKRDDLLKWVDNEDMLNKKIHQAVSAYKNWKSD